MTVTIIASGQTDLGRVRKNNEDALLVANLVTGSAVASHQAVVGERGVLLAVADGMGGELAGEVASVMALDVMRRHLDDHLERAAPHEALRRSVEDAHAAVRAESSRSQNHRGMGATLTAALVHGVHAFVAEVGDSRAYLIRRGRIAQITHDQSYVQMLLDAHAITPEQAASFPHKNVILQALGKEEIIHVALTRVELRRGDRLLLCTDGLSNKVSDDEMLEVVGRGGPPVSTCAALIRLANDRGAEDNVTLVCAALEGALPVPRPDEVPLSTFKTLSEFHEAIPPRS